jgi:acyl-CoA thioesterase
MAHRVHFCYYLAGRSAHLAGPGPVGWQDCQSAAAGHHSAGWIAAGFPARGNRHEGEFCMQRMKQFFMNEDKFARHCGIELLDLAPGWARACLRIEPHHFNGARTVHGGAIFTLADFAFAVASNSHGNLAMGINTSVSFVKAATRGILYAEAREQSKNPRLASYSVLITDDDGDTVAIFQGMVYRKPEAIIPDHYPAGGDD